MTTKQTDAVAMTDEQLDAVAGGAAFIGYAPGRSGRNVHTDGTSISAGRG